MQINETQEAQDMVRLIARVIWPEALDGLTDGGRMDEADTLTKAEEIYDELQLHFLSLTQRKIAAVAQHEGMRMFDGEGFSDLSTVARDYDDVQEIVNDHVFDADRWIKDLDIDFQEVSQR